MQGAQGRGLRYPEQTQQANEHQGNASLGNWVVSTALGAVLRVERTPGSQPTMLRSLAPWLELRCGDESTPYLCSVHHNPPGFWIQWGRHLDAAHSGWGRSCCCCHTQASCEVCIAETDMEDIGAVKVENARTHTHTHTHTHTNTKPSCERNPFQGWLLNCQDTGSLSSGISDPTQLVLEGPQMVLCADPGPGSSLLLSEKK